MERITVAQLIFSCVERQYSPENRSGYQIVRSPSICSNEEKSYIKNRIQCFRINRENPTRLQFFTLKNQKYVVSRTCLLPPNKMIMDSEGREGFLVHALIISDEEFQKIDYNPFSIIDNYDDFVDSNEELVRRFRNDPIGTAPNIDIFIRSNETDSLQKWDIKDFPAFFSLTYGIISSDFAKPKTKFIGKGNHVEDVLKISLYLSSPKQRRVCAFDTNVDGCPGNYQGFWAVGTSLNDRYVSNLSLIPVTETAVEFPNQFTSDLGEFWNLWFTRIILKHDTSLLLEYLPTTRLMINALTHNRSINYEQLDEDARLFFYSIFSSNILDSISNVLITQTNKNIAMRLMQYVENDFSGYSSFYFNIASSKSINADSLGQLLIMYLLYNKSPKFSKQDWKLLHSISNKSGNNVLLFRTSVALNKLNRRKRRKIMFDMSDSNYQYCLKWLLDPIDPVHFVTNSKIHTLLQNPKLKTMTDKQLLALIVDAIKEGGEPALDPLIPRISKANYKTTKKIQSITRRNSAFSVKFRKLIEQI